MRDKEMNLYPFSVNAFLRIPTTDSIQKYTQRNHPKNNREDHLRSHVDNSTGFDWIATRIPVEAVTFSFIRNVSSLTNL